MPAKSTKNDDIRKIVKSTKSVVKPIKKIPKVQKEQKEKKNATRKKAVPKAMREKKWKDTFGEVFDGKCYVCDRDLKFDNFDAGHIIAEANGGKTTIDNLRIVCRTCNTSCGTKNMDDFKLAMTSEKINVSDTKKIETGTTEMKTQCETATVQINDRVSSNQGIESSFFEAAPEEVRGLTRRPPEGRSREGGLRLGNDYDISRELAKILQKLQISDQKRIAEPFSEPFSESSIVQIREKTQTASSDDPIDSAVMKVTKFLNDVKQTDGLLACKLVENKANRIKKCVEKMKQENPSIIQTHYLNNIENLLPNSQYSSYLGFKNNQSMKQYYDKWFVDIQCELNNYMSDNNVVSIINEVF